MFGRDTTSRFAERSSMRPGPGAYDPHTALWDETTGAAANKFTAPRFKSLEPDERGYGGYAAAPAARYGHVDQPLSTLHPRRDLAGLGCVKPLNTSTASTR